MSAGNPLFDHLRDLHAHMAWADAVWFHTWAGSGHQDDPDLLQRMQHTADVQGAFLMVLQDQEVLFPGDPPVPGFDRLRALTQVAMHTQHHRGQCMTRLKALGGKPQNVDYIIWAWKNRPEGRWD